jgi:hypothetical protein
MLGAESEADTPGVAADGDPILLGSGATSSSDAGASTHGSPGKARLSGARGILGQGTTASLPGEAGSSADGGSAATAASTGSSTPATAAEPEVAPKQGHKVEFLNPKFILMALYDMQILAPQVNQLIWMMLLMIQTRRKQCKKKLRHFIRMGLGILFLLLRVPILLTADGFSRLKGRQMEALNNTSAD